MIHKRVIAFVACLVGVGCKDEPKRLEIFPSGYVEPLRLEVEEVVAVEGDFVLSPDQSRVHVACTVKSGEVRSGDIVRTPSGVEGIVEGISIEKKSHFRAAKGKEVVLRLVGPTTSDIAVGDVLREVDE